jgi:flagellar motility protein MotE (MotC chaperone)
MTSFNMKRGRFARLLPAVVGLGAVVLVLNTTGLVRVAYAQADEKVAALTNDPVASNKDYAGGEGDEVASANEVDVMNSLGKRRRELDVRNAQLTTQANMIAAAEMRVDAKISQLKQLQTQINALLVQRDDAQKAQIASLVKTYSTMKAKDAARIFNNLPDDVLIPVAHDMKPDIMALILSNMSADAAKTLTVKLANKLTLPQTTDAVAPTPVPLAAAAPVAAPVQMAAAPAAAAEPVAAAPVKTPARRKSPAKLAAPAAASPAAKPAETASSATAPAAAASAPTPAAPSLPPASNNEEKPKA